MPISAAEESPDLPPDSLPPSLPSSLSAEVVEVASAGATEVPVLLAVADAVPVDAASVTDEAASVVPEAALEAALEAVVAGALELAAAEVVAAWTEELRASVVAAGWLDVAWAAVVADAPAEVVEAAWLAAAADVAALLSGGTTAPQKPPRPLFVSVSVPPHEAVQSRMPLQKLGFVQRHPESAALVHWNSTKLALSRSIQ